MYTVKKVSYFPVPSRDVTNQTLLVSDIPAGDGKIANLFLQWTVIRFVSISAKFGTCTVVGLKETLVEGANAKLRTNLDETDYILLKRNQSCTKLFFPYALVQRM